ncbi:MAG: hypothetical protein JSR82_06610 [Verrucomicrobia bacterium]|nr:hypothetical protein [Verrucomicrobiota bacterium]
MTSQPFSPLKLLERSFELRGPRGLGAKPKPELIGPILTHLHDTLQDTVRMGFLHSSRATGRISAPLKAAAEVRYLGHTAPGEDSTVLHFEVPPFGAAAEELFRQQLLWEDGPGADETAFELLGAALRDVGARKSESNRFDPPLLRRIAGYRRMLERGIERISLPDTALAQAGAFDAEAIEAAQQLSALTPPARRVRIAGRLDLMGASQGVLKLQVQPGQVVTAIWQGEAAIETLREHFNQEVVLEGTGVFRPSGSLLRVDAEAIARAGQQDEFFRRLPEGRTVAGIQNRVRLRAGEPSAYARILGSIPAEESDEEFAAAVEAMS